MGWPGVCGAEERWRGVGCGVLGKGEGERVQGALGGRYGRVLGDAQRSLSVWKGDVLVREEAHG